MKKLHLHNSFRHNKPMWQINGIAGSLCQNLPYSGDEVTLCP
jgi:hypothetical protein